MRRTWKCWPAVMGGTLLWPTLGTTIGMVESSVKELWESCTGFRLPGVFSLAANHTHTHDSITVPKSPCF